ncbi:MAG: hypothetical protein IIC90_04280 [Chloroflexi bacterium]|nr:hypothetical protein [Chloroflexota bacterium]
MALRRRPAFDWRRWLLGGRNSWRRIVLAGIGGGVALALVAALVAALFSVVGGSGSGSLDDEEPTAAAPVFVPADDEPIPTLPPVDVVASPTPTPPAEASPEPSATFVAPVATPTLAPEPTPTLVPEEVLPTSTEVAG